jgi:hypothetical protein
MEQDQNVKELFEFLLDWSVRNNYSLVLPTDDQADVDVDFININLKTNTMYMGILGIDKPLTEVG